MWYLLLLGGTVVMNCTLDEEVWSLEPEVPKFGADWKMEFCMWEEKVEAGVVKALWKRREMSNPEKKSECG